MNAKPLLAAASLALAAAPASATDAFSVDYAVSGYEGTATLENFPVLVRLSEGAPSGFSYDDCKADGSDVHFQDADGGELAFDVDVWDPDGESLVWVKLPAMAAGTAFSMRYGGETAFSDNAPESVWSAYGGVWHMNESAATQTDRTGNGLDAAAAGGVVVTLADGPVGTAVSKSGAMQTADFFAAGRDYTVPSRSYTVSGWYKWPDWSATANANPLQKGTWEADSWYLQHKTGQSYSATKHLIMVYKGTVDDARRFAVPDCRENWNHLAVVYDGSTMKVYLNGDPAPAYSVNRTLSPGSQPFTIGSTAGLADETRVLRAAASADWIAADYAAQTSASFLSAGEVRMLDRTEPVVSLSASVLQYTNVAFTASVGWFGQEAGGGAAASWADLLLVASASADFSTPVASVSLGRATSAAPMRAVTLEHFETNATYYAKVLATNEFSAAAESETVSFTTRAPSSAAGRRVLAARAYETADGTAAVKVDFEAGEAGADHALYVAFDTADRGSDPAAWAAFQRIGRVAPEDVSACAPLVPSALSNGWTHARAFLVENALAYDTLVPRVRQTGTQWLDTGYRPGPATRAEISYSLDDGSTAQQRIFGVESTGSDAVRFAFALYVNGWNPKTLSSACTDGAGDYTQLGFPLGTDAEQTVVLDAAPAGATGAYLASYSVAETGASGTKTVSTTRTATSAGALAVFARRLVASDGTETIDDVVKGGTISRLLLSEGGTPVHDFRPCVTGGVAGFWDAVSNAVAFSAEPALPFFAEGEPLFCRPADEEVVLSSSPAFAVGAAGLSGARAFSDARASYRPNGETNVAVRLAAGAAGAGHALYLAYAEKDMGESLADWPAFQRVGPVADSACSVTAAVSRLARPAGAEVCRAFLVEDARPFDALVERVRQTGTQWIDTGVRPCPGSRAEIGFRLDSKTPAQQRLFGVESSGNAAALFTFSAYVNGQSCLSVNSLDGGGHWRNTYVGVDTEHEQILVLDSRPGFSSYSAVVTNTATGASTTFYFESARTKTSAGTLPVFTRRVFAADGTNSIDTDNDYIVHGGTLSVFRLSVYGTVLRDLRPCALADGSGALYDLANEILYRSESAEDFALESDVLPVSCTPALAEAPVSVSRLLWLVPRRATIIVVR